MTKYVYNKERTEDKKASHQCEMIPTKYHEHYECSWPELLLKLHQHKARECSWNSSIYFPWKMPYRFSYFSTSNITLTTENKIKKTFLCFILWFFLYLFLFAMIFSKVRPRYFCTQLHLAKCINTTSMKISLLYSFFIWRL